MTTDTRVVALLPIPASAQAMEDRLREIRQETTQQERLDAYRRLLGVQ